MMEGGTCDKVETYIAHNKQKRKMSAWKRDILLLLDPLPQFLMVQFDIEIFLLIKLSFFHMFMEDGFKLVK